MGKARVVAPPPKDHIPEPLVSAPPPPEEVVVEEWNDGNFQEEILDVENSEPPQEELEKERIAQEKYEELQRKKVDQEFRISVELQGLREENERLTRENGAAARSKEEQILKARQQATKQRSNQHMVQLNMTPKTPTLINKIKTLFRKRRIKSATNGGIKNYETAILERARIAVPKMLDDMENMHEQLTILEDLLTKYSEVKGSNNNDVR
jgi:hypothetical protein